MNTIRYNCGVCTNKAEVQTAVWNFCNQTNNKQTHLIIVNSAKDDIFTSFMNYSIVDVILTESSNVWSNHPSFFMYDANGDACTGQLSVTSATMAVSGEPWQKLVAEGSATAIKHTGPINGGAQIQVARKTGRVYRVSMFRNASSSVALVDQWEGVAYITNTGSFVITADSTNITIKNNTGAYCNVVVEEM